MPSVLSVIAGLLLLAVVSSQQRPAGPGFWESLDVNGSSADDIGDLSELVAASDLIVVGQVTDARRGRTLGELLVGLDHPEDGLVPMASLSLHVQRVIRGNVSTNPLTLEVMIASDDHVHYLSKTIPNESGLFFLRVKNDPAYYGFVLPQSFASNTDGLVASAPGTHAYFLRAWDRQPFASFEESVATEVDR